MDEIMKLNELSAALSAFQGEMKSVVFDSTNPFFKSKYASLSALVNQAAPLLAKYGLAVSQTMTPDGGVRTILMHKSGASISGELRLKPVKEDPQGVGSAITYARRYSYAAILGLVSDEDDDGNVASRTNGVHSEAITEQELQVIFDLMADTKTEERIVLNACKIASFKEMTRVDYQKAVAALKAKAARK